MKNISSKQTLALTGFVILALATGLAAPAYAQKVEKVLTLGAVGPTSGAFGLTGQSGEVQIEAKPEKTSLEFSLTGLTPNAVHGVWLILDTTKAPFSGCPSCMATDTATGTTAAVFPFTPAAADTAGFTAGNGLDPNGFVTDASGNAEFEIKLDYNIFGSAVAPVVLKPGVTQAVGVAPASGPPPTCAASGSALSSVIDSGYMHVYDTSTTASLPGTSPSFPLLDAPLKPRLVRANVVAIVVVEHFDGLTHGHRPGLDVGSSAGACGDNAGRLRGKLADAVTAD